ncbi:ESCO2 acetyltransferase, partial [Crypturellus undulatus]|nr:ESCO2 acetyltransferase [Crypturellus undulatus]
YKPIVPVMSFYRKEKQYLTPLERKLLNENFSLSERKNDENLPTASRTEKTQVNLSRNTNSRPAKRTTNSRQGKAAPNKLKKAKGDTAPGKPSTEKENVNSLIKKKMDAPFRVLSMKVKPALKLQSGAAFFTAKKKSHSGSKKLPVDHKGPQGLPVSPQGKDQPTLPTANQPNSGDTHKNSEADGALRRISVPQKKEKEPREEFTSLKNEERGAVGEGKASLQQSSSSPAQARCYDQEVIPSSQSPRKGTKKGESVCDLMCASCYCRKNEGNLEESATPCGSNPPAKLALSLPKSKKTKELCKRSKDQMIIDAGQKHFGAVICNSCGMIYTAASPEDEAQHIQHHERFLEGLRYVGWKKERVVAEFWDGKIVLILPDDPKYAVKKAEEVREIVDNELGFKQVTLNCPSKTKMYLFVSNEKMIVGCLVAEPIKQAFRVLSEPGAAQAPGQDVLQPQRAWRCSAEPEPALCGVSRVWVFSLARRKGIARRMVDAARNTFTYGCYLSTDEIAFSDPTPDGKLFATKYCQTPNFLVYNFICYN